ncbi:hypothetical protein GNQ08_27160 [Paenibacillus macerans]|uniref:Uncharacterized protein n=1 Tax=Paenibacillus macerans TaxID=44252 RepID=A0A6N8F271_PAEMA|nr:hypothetical protein [Paenibacillus macerans]MDU5946980.1 hypothetical protein [Paenibacillus macerans]MUG26045.1 hypothetical protein [Paenibacillus macerans]
MAAKAKVRAILKALNEIRDALPVDRLEQLIDEIQSDVLLPIEEKLDDLADKDRLTEKQEARQSALEEEQNDWESVIDEIETYKDTLDEIESLIDLVQGMEE